MSVWDYCLLYKKINTDIVILPIAEDGNELLSRITKDCDSFNPEGIQDCYILDSFNPSILSKLERRIDSQVVHSSLLQIASYCQMRFLG